MARPTVPDVARVAKYSQTSYYASVNSYSTNVHHGNGERVDYLQYLNRSYRSIPNF